MEKYKLLILKFLLLAGVFIGINFIYVSFFYENDLQKHSPIINSIRKAINEKSEIVYLGESSNTTFRDDDLDKRSISELISDYYPSRKLFNINKEASHAGIYYAFLRNIPKSSTVKTVIVTLNLRSFDAGWINSNLETPLQKSLVLINKYPPLFNRLLLSFKGYDIKSDAERDLLVKKSWTEEKLMFDKPFQYSNITDWDFGKSVTGIRNPNGSINTPQTELACHYIKTYAFQIDTLTNPRIKDFDKIVALAHERNWNLVLNLMAENVDKAESLVGEELISLIKKNHDLLVKRYNKNNVILVDNLSIVQNDEFIDQNWTTEHYSEYGRKLIAKNVARALRQFYPNDFIDVSSNSKKPTTFFNDCEGKTIWSQMQTLTTEKYFSGAKSSRCGQKQDYSLTFEYEIRNLPDSLKNIFVSFQKFQNEISPDIKIAFELSGGRVDYRLTTFPLKDFSGKINKWDEVKFNYDLPKDFYDSTVLKIYVYNPTNKLVYIDDLRIEF